MFGKQTLQDTEIQLLSFTPPPPTHCE